VGEVGFSVATVASISLGIIVDDTVHFLSKYVRAKNERGHSAEESIRYACESVGIAIIVNTVILAIGFAVLTDMWLLTVTATVFALILDFLFLPALPPTLDNKSKSRNNSQSINEDETIQAG
jgi:predicted RND superfamily exporter protein